MSAVDEIFLAVTRAQRTNAIQTEVAVVTSAVPVIPKRVEMFEEVKASLLAAQSKNQELDMRAKSSKLIPYSTKVQIFVGLNAYKKTLTSVTREMRMLYYPSADDQYSDVLKVKM